MTDRSRVDEIMEAIRNHHNPHAPGLEPKATVKRVVGEQDARIAELELHQTAKCVTCGEFMPADRGECPYCRIAELEQKNAAFEEENERLRSEVDRPTLAEATTRLIDEAELQLTDEQVVRVHHVYYGGVEWAFTVHRSDHYLTPIAKAFGTQRDRIATLEREKVRLLQRLNRQVRTHDHHPAEDWDAPQ